MAGTPDVTIEATTRQDLGKGACRRIRAAGDLPANVIDKASGNKNIILKDPKFLSKAWQNGKTFNLVLDGDTKQVTIKELQLHPVKRAALHVDLMYV